MEKKDIVSAVKFTSYVTSMLAVGCTGSHYVPKGNKVLKAAYILGAALIGTPMVLSVSDYWAKVAEKMVDKHFDSEQKEE